MTQDIPPRDGAVPKLARAEAATEAGLSERQHTADQILAAIQLNPCRGLSPEIMSDIRKLNSFSPATPHTATEKAIPPQESQ